MILSKGEYDPGDYQAFSLFFLFLSEMDAFIDQQVQVITNDGRVIVGKLRALDQNINIVLEKSEERGYSTEEGVRQAPLGLFMIRGDNVAVVGQIDQDLDAQLDFTAIRAAPLQQILHQLP
ncbi:putative N-alpha-acetyltransferase 38; NatC auxiliary subunit [Paratrimastix pyriformis]|uniref:U6 snRNA-associated Sm-like protein LSm8 n=1 Tax=Paratrimastix pyriformis TaxID=342808 RepID=A0ABQ8UC49_9EUKA|nr:putative N-alpha-acetyltransferase 38; NatC auxiliary subunit [Paratrimastix pyriformis]